MFGIVVDRNQEETAREFFELFKTPWEFARSNRHYSVLLVAHVSNVNPSADLVIRVAFDSSKASQDSNTATLADTPAGDRLVLYRGIKTFPGTESALLTDQATGKAIAKVEGTPIAPEIRLGYDLFAEIEFLLRYGQPPEFAALPTLDTHIGFLRSLLVSFGVSFIEVVSTPADHGCIACLTHDIDHPLIRNHRWDQTALGFLYRATLGSLIRGLRGRLSFTQVCRNWVAATRLPLVHAGLAGDFWGNFDRYSAVESGCKGTYFVIPKRGEPGKQDNESAPAIRAAAYAPKDIEPQLRLLAKNGHEIGVHGVDAWNDPKSGLEERKLIAEVSSIEPQGIRMHWLYFDQVSPRVLEDAGYSYDSTIGYNETIGFRAGTAQVFRPLGTKDILELPLIIMDTALFYPSYLDLGPSQAWMKVKQLLDTCRKTGGAITINWHDRSIAPERQWEPFYIKLLNELKARQTWFPTCSEATAWFRKRRDVRYEVQPTVANREIVQVSSVTGTTKTPPLLVRHYRAKPKSANWPITFAHPTNYTDHRLNDGSSITIDLN